LSGRKQLVKINGLCSKLVDVTSGVPRGGHLSPVLFSLFIYGIKRVIHHKDFLIFADDVKLFLRVNSAQGCRLLLNDFDSVVLWARELGLELSIPKCRVMSYTRSNDSILFSYSISDITIQSSDDCVVDLGITFDQFLNFKAHIEKVTCKALKLLGFVKRISGEFKLSSPLKHCIVRSALECSMVIWDPCTLDGSYQLEKVLRKFLKFAAFILHIECTPHEYAPVLQRLGLSTLCDRRKQGNLTFLSKLIDGGVDALAQLSKVSFRLPAYLPRYSIPFRIPFSSFSYLINRPIVRMMKLANEDPLFLNSYT